MIGFENLKGKTLTKIMGEVGDEEMFFYTDKGEIFVLYHEQD